MATRKSGQREGGKADRAWDKKHPGVKEGSKQEEAFDKRMGFKVTAKKTAPKKKK